MTSASEGTRHASMMDYPLTPQRFMEREHKFYPNQEIATQQGAQMHRYT